MAKLQFSAALIRVGAQYGVLIPTAEMNRDIFRHGEYVTVTFESKKVDKVKIKEALELLEHYGYNMDLIKSPRMLAGEKKF